MNSILNEMMSEVGLSDGANTSHQQYQWIHPSLRLYFKDFKEKLVKIKSYITAFNRPGFLINCLQFSENVQYQSNLDSVFLKAVKYKENVFICFGEDNVKDAVLLLNYLEKEYVDLIITRSFFMRLSWNINFGDDNEEYVFWNIVDHYILMQKNMDMLLKGLAYQLLKGVYNRNKFFADHYSILFEINAPPQSA